MGATGSTLSTLSPKSEDNVHFYEAFRKMKLDKMSDEEIYKALKKKYVHKTTRPGRQSVRNDSLQNVALQHFSQTLETNRIVFEKKKNITEEGEFGPVARSHSCEKLNIHYEEQHEPSPLERLPLGSPIMPKKLLAIEISPPEVKDNVILPPPQKIIAKQSKRPQLTVCIDSGNDENEGGLSAVSQQAQQQQQQQAEGAETVRTPRVEGRISPSGAVHVGRFAINEHGLRSEMTGRESPHAFLTAGKSDFVEVGFLGSGATSSIIEALHIPTLSIVALKMLPAKDSSDLQCISSELSVLYQNLAELRLIDGRLDEEDNSDDEEKTRERQTMSSPCEQVLALYDGEYSPSLPPSHFFTVYYILEAARFILLVLVLLVLAQPSWTRRTGW
jgi:hypothetical protein